MKRVKFMPITLSREVREVELKYLEELIRKGDIEDIANFTRMALKKIDKMVYLVNSREMGMSLYLFELSKIILCINKCKLKNPHVALYVRSEWNRLISFILDTIINNITICNKAILINVMIALKALLEKNLLSKMDLDRLPKVYESLIHYVFNSSEEITIIDISNILLSFKVALISGTIQRGTLDIEVAHTKLIEQIIENAYIFNTLDITNTLNGLKVALEKGVVNSGELTITAYRNLIGRIANMTEPFDTLQIANILNGLRVALEKGAVTFDPNIVIAYEKLINDINQSKPKYFDNGERCKILCALKDALERGIITDEAYESVRWQFQGAPAHVRWQFRVAPVPVVEPTVVEPTVARQLSYGVMVL